MILEKDIRDSLYGIECWISANGWAGYDPYDLRGQDWYVKAFGFQNAICTKIRSVLAIIEKSSSPAFLRKVFFVNKLINPKGMGLLASAYISTYKSTQKEYYLIESEKILEWLFENVSKNEYSGYSWGYPFHWHSRLFFPKGTPSTVATGTIGDAWLDHFLLTGAIRSIEISEGIASFFLNSINRSFNKNGQFCFSYTPIDNFKVHNASLFVAAFLVRLGKITNNQTYIETALQAVHFTLSEQNADGSFNYWSNEPNSLIDHYHTGFVLRHLDTIQSSISEVSFTENINRGYEFYRNNLFKKSGIPMFSPKSTYPIDVHSCAEAILCLNQFEDKPLNDQLLASVLDFIQKNMLSSKGYYIAAIRKRLWGEQKIDIPYMRWGQCWMFLAFAKLFEKINKL